MTRSTLRFAAGILLAVTLLLPGMAAAREISSGRRAEPAFSLARLWKVFVQSLPDGWTAAMAQNWWQIDPDGKPASTPSSDNGWQIDPNG